MNNKRTCDNCKHNAGLPSNNGTMEYSGVCKNCVAKDMWEMDGMFTNGEIRKAIEKYQKEHPLQFGAMIDVTAISSKEGADIISQTIEQVAKKVDEDTELWCICEMAKMYMQGVSPVYPVKQQEKWIPVSERLPNDLEPVNITWVNHEPEPYYKETKDKPFTATGVYFNGQWYWWSSLCIDILEYNGFSYDDMMDTAIEVVAWQPLPEPYKRGDAE